MLRMARDELGFRPLAVAGTYEVGARACRECRGHSWARGWLACMQCWCSWPLPLSGLTCRPHLLPQTATAAQVLAAPKVSSEGVFGNFKVPAEGLQHEWVALPNWSLLTLAGHPVALTIENCANIPEVRLSSQAKVRGGGQGLGMGGCGVGAAGSILAAAAACLAAAAGPSHAHTLPPPLQHHNDRRRTS